jgi:hypothetical protein
MGRDRRTADRQTGFQKEAMQSRRSYTHVQLRSTDDAGIFLSIWNPPWQVEEDELLGSSYQGLRRLGPHPGRWGWGAQETVGA